MDGEDLGVLRRCAEWMQAGRRVVLFTVARTWGSAPRPPGALLAVCDDGRVEGSVSGGCIEDDLVARVRSGGLALLRPQILRYGVSADEARRLGLPCGGTIEFVAEPLGPASRLDALLLVLEEQRLVARRLDLRSGSVELLPASALDGLDWDGTTLTCIHGPRYRMLLIGASQLSKFVARFATALDYQVVVCDPRSEYGDVWDVPGVERLTAMPDDAVHAMRIDGRCAVIALTHDPKLDDLALIEALKSPAFYVGALGSRANNAGRRERLRLFDLTEAQIARLHGPVGLAIGSRTPSEIAVSILAEIIAVKNGVAAVDRATVARGRVAAAPSAGCGA